MSHNYLSDLLLPSEQARRDKRAERFIDAVISDSGVARINWGVGEWEMFAKSLTSLLFEEAEKSAQARQAGGVLFNELKRRILNDKKRIENRKDQVDKREFQIQAQKNINTYTTKASAIRDLQYFPQFENYPEKTLRRWLSEIWTKETKSGRPKKRKC
ncbi:MAG: hypothetical protein K8F56_15800 [Rhodocyclaceae bacterium]|nr:hypothetical protein [Rhodocyclaceae bacterium]